jgi:hypothetical protein
MAPAHKVAEPKDMKDNIRSLTSGIQKMALPSQADKGSMDTPTTNLM